MFENQKENNKGVKSLDKRKNKKDKQMPRRITYEAKKHLIMQEIAKGTTFMNLVTKFCTEWDLGYKTVVAEIQDAIRDMQSQETKDALIAMNLQRLDSVIEDSITNGDKKNAIKAIDVQNKLAGGYENKIKIEGDSDINFTFNIGE